MKRMFLATMMLLLSGTLASAATVTFTIGNKSKTYTISAANAARANAWAAAAYPTILNPAFDPAKPVDPTTNPQTITNPEPVLSAIDGLWEGIKNNVISWEHEQGKKAVPNPAPID